MFGIFKRRREDELAEIEAEITAFGEELARLPFDPTEHGADPDLIADYTRALDAYDQAKRYFLGDRDRADAADVLRTLNEGRSTLARVNAALTGRPLCFFDPRHGPSTQRVTWAPPGGAYRDIDVCAADAIRLTEGLPPITTGALPEADTPRRRDTPRLKNVEPPKDTGTARRPREPTQTSEPSRPRRQPGPFKVAPPALGKEHQAASRGAGEALLQKPDWDAPSILVIRLHGSLAVDDIKEGFTFPLAKVPRSPGPRRSRLVLPLPLSTNWPVKLRIREGESQWSIWLQAADTAPTLEWSMVSRGSYICRYIGGATRIQMQHRSRGRFSVTELDQAFNRGARVLSGEGIASAKGELAGPVFLHVEAPGEWTLRVI